jgi:hypothetical protein
MDRIYYILLMCAMYPSGDLPFGSVSVVALIYGGANLHHGTCEILMQ